MTVFQKIAAWVGGLGVLALALWLGTILFVALLIIIPVAVLIGRWRLGKMRKEFESAQRQARAERDGQVIETEYVVVDRDKREEGLDPERDRRH